LIILICIPGYITPVFIYCQSITMAAQAPGAAAAAALQLRRDEFEDVLMNIVGLNRGQFNHIVSEGLEVAEDLIRLDEDSLLGIFPAAGALAIKAMARMKLKTLRAWTINQSNLLEDPSEDIEILYFTEDVCDKLQRKLALADIATKDGSQAKVATGITPGTFNGKGVAWPPPPNGNCWPTWDNTVVDLVFP
jgi:hypothetical protein